ncbi:nucleotide sugar dehydrogenase [Sphingomonas sp. LY160]|uniref:nucleotide sugar dehydrogenase n=1 Tax=Sphingomonas sp. LY160 TaxID=3095342 RepID=UPI002ADEDB4E|nr:nucleotide sugar dehydrogenase [Sphingomonas sp. LY160]MEA1071528.1 nucleotide sugar dehydrogenase [Sphingomonas sp. LY160]
MQSIDRKPPEWTNKAHRKVVVVGLGYVGLPLAVALARTHDDIQLVGFDVSQSRVDELTAGHDRTGEVEPDALAAARMQFVTDDEACRGADIIIVTVPTPVDDQHRPDFGPLLSASKRLAGWIDAAKRPTIVYESTVYPGATDEECAPVIEQVSGLTRGRDFRLGYSPERINPGDKIHRVDKIVKVIAGEDAEVTEELAHLYGAMTEAGVFRAASIRAAEAAKAIENAQRDINIAFMNEIAQILSKTGVSVWDVLDAARTKWNFLPFEPGLVGGHCIGVDPYYLSHHAQRMGHDPRVILSGRGTNDAMGAWIADELHSRIGPDPKRVLVLGITFKEDVPDVRNSRSIDVIDRLKHHGHNVSVADPLADRAEVEHEYGLALVDPADGAPYDCLVAAVSHADYRALDANGIAALTTGDGLVADLKGIWRGIDLPPGLGRWSL